MNKYKNIIGMVLAFLLFSPVIALGANDVNTAYQSNGTEIALTATWTEYQNVSMATGTGNTTVYLSALVSTNSTQAKLYGRIKRDGVVVESLVLSRSINPEVATLVATVAETEATHNYTFEAYCTTGKTCTIFNRTFSAQYLNTGSFGSTSAIAALQVNDTYFNGTLFPNSTNFKNDTISTHTTQITALQNNDTYFNGTVYPNSTNFRNDSALQTSTYSGNFPNSTVASKEATWDAKGNASYPIDLANASQASGIILNASLPNRTVSNLTGTYVFNVNYTSPAGRSIMVFVTANFSADTTAGSRATIRANSGLTNLSGTVGIVSSSNATQYNGQLVFIVAPNTNYAVNSTTSGGGTVTLEDWREVLVN